MGHGIVKGLARDWRWSERSEAWGQPASFQDSKREVESAPTGSHNEMGVLATESFPLFASSNCCLESVLSVPLKCLAPIFVYHGYFSVGIGIGLRGFDLRPHPA
jgi:hypothetical protein